MSGRRENPLLDLAYLLFLKGIISRRFYVDAVNKYTTHEGPESWTGMILEGPRDE